MKRWLKLSSLTGSYVSCYTPLGSEDWGILDSDIQTPLVDQRQVGFLFDPIFRKPNKLLKQRWPTRHCDNLQLSGTITVGRVLNENLNVLGSLTTTPSIIFDGLVYINARSPYDELEYHESGSPGVLKGLIWKTWSFQVTSEDAPYTRVDRITNFRYMYVVSFSYRPDTNRAYAYTVVLAVDMAHERLYLIRTSVARDYTSFDEARRYAREEVKGTAETQYVLGDEIFSPLYHAGITIVPPSDLEAVRTAFHSLDAGMFNEELRAEMDLTLFRRAVDRFRPKRVSFFETILGFAELPLTIQNIVRTMYTLAGKAVPATMALKALIGLYLCYIYAFRPMPGDAKVMASWLRTLTNYTRFDGTSIQTEAPFSWNGWVGRQRVEIALTPLITDVPVDLNSEFDRIDEKRTLRVSDEFQLVPRIGNTQLDILNLQDVFPVNPGDIAADVWNTIGYSFVYDWGIDLDGRLRNMGTNSYMAQLPVRFSCQSVKAEKNISEQIIDLFRVSVQADVSASVTAIKYERRYADAIPPLPDFEYQPTSISSIWMQGTALLLQRFL